MRKIKFRGKCRVGGKWYFGDLFHFKDSNGIEDGTLGIDDSEAIIEILPETVGEFTGLQDADGKDIYEGDIVLFYGFGRTILNVHFENSAFGVGGKNGLPKRAGDAFTLLSDLVKVEKVYVVGNIHENPELLEGVD